MFTAKELILGIISIIILAMIIVALSELYATL